MIELRNAIRNICEETVKALAEADSNMRHYAYCSIEGKVTLDITLRGAYVEGCFFSPTGEDYRENEISIKGIGIHLAPNGPSNHVPDN